MTHIGSLNPMWKGNDVSYRVLHKYIRRHKPISETCEICKINPPLDVANISDTYTRNLDDYKWMCRSCHFRYDNKVVSLGIHALKTDMSGYVCVKCGSTETGIRKENGRPKWMRLDRKPLCSKCYRHLRWLTFKA